MKNRTVMKVVSINEVVTKVVFLPHKGDFAVIEMLHKRVK